MLIPTRHDQCKYLSGVANDSLGLIGIIGNHVGSLGSNDGCILSHLFNKVKEVSISIRSICWSLLVLLAEMRSRRMQSLNGRVAECEKRRFRC